MANVKDGASKTLNRVTKWDNVGTPSISDSIIHDDGANVGIGVTGPGAKLEVEGDAASAGSESIALKVTDGSVSMFEVVDDHDTGANEVTVLRSTGGHLCVIPKEKSGNGIQQAINYLTRINNEGGIVYLPAGTYDVSSTITIGEGRLSSPLNDGSGIQIIGAGVYKTIIRIYGGGTPIQTGINVFQIQGGRNDARETVSIPSEHIVMRDFQIIMHQQETDNIHTGIYIEHGTSSLFENLRIWGAPVANRRLQYGIRCSCWSNVFHCCYIKRVGTAGIDIRCQLLPTTNDASGGNNNTVNACNVLGFSDGRGISVGNGSDAHCMNNKIINSCIQNVHQGTAIYIDTRAEETLVSGCYMEAVDTGIYIDAVRNTIIGNYNNQVGTLVEFAAGKKAGNLLIGVYPNSQSGENFPAIASDLDIADTTELGAESLSNGDFSSGSTDWSTEYGFSISSQQALYQHTPYGGTLTQASGDLAVQAVGNRWYKFTYTMSNVNNASGTLQAHITDAFPSSDVYLLMQNGTHSVYFKSTSSPGMFRISATSADQYDTFTLDALGLKEIQGGDAVVNGLITGGGTSGIKVLSNGYTGIGTTSPAESLELKGGQANIALCPATDHYPSLQIFDYSHDNVSINFDSYYRGGQWKSGDPGSNFRIYKIGDRLRFSYASGVAQGSEISAWEDENDNCALVILSNGAVGVRTTSPSSYADLTLEGGALCLKERATPTADENYGKLYTKTDNKLYFQDGAGAEHVVAFA